MAAQATGFRPHRYVGKAARRRLRHELSDRDRHVLSSLTEHRFLTTHHLSELHFVAGASSRDTAGRSARRVLQRLARDGLVRRVDDRRVGGLRGGSEATIWHLTAAGARVLDEHAPRYRQHQPTLRFLEHCLAIADTHLLVLQIAQSMRGSANVMVDPHTTRRYPGLGGNTLTLAPDLSVVIQASDDDGPYEDRWFIEVDRGTESIPTLLAKCEQYEAYRRSGIEQSQTDGAFPLVLWILEGRRAHDRKQELTRRLQRSARLTPQLHRLTSTSDETWEALVTGGQS
ncbi:protein involved in plasmid replication-relaxation [Barrientosiimonas humi]|uniref:Protein involved in plasmid replication-relaxation n=1 Tax=Barrientosiimonas humi TaxID=999931 RepID=A0A542XEM4_9MICO|nr:replication-relaxation family protein [Barrientosiimonas humi]TQL34246.1 protein involved in plasmid replication-relaxation [Barrientosiimonas humi]CAG7574238.1 hypothetical protein BH39T_PBIAJDOK_02881 [Barrientosiimonas humi]